MIKCRACKIRLAKDNWSRIQRATQNFICKSCYKKEMGRKWRDAHGDWITTYHKKYNAENADEISRKAKIYYAMHPEEISASRKLHYQRNRKSILEKSKAYYHDNKEEISERKKPYNKKWYLENKAWHNQTSRNNYKKNKKHMGHLHSEYWKSPAGKLANARHHSRRRGWGAPRVILGNPFKGSHLHHTTKDVAIYIPETLHRSIYHNLETGYNMDKINVLAMGFFLYGQMPIVA